jgi:structure-specific recognition protein 1
MQNMKNSNPDLATTEIAKKLGEMWQKMSCNIPEHSSWFKNTRALFILVVLGCLLCLLLRQPYLCTYGFLFSWAAEDRRPFVQQAQADKKRYEKETGVYRGAAQVEVDSGNGSD